MSHLTASEPVSPSLEDKVWRNLRTSPLISHGVSGAVFAVNLALKRPFPNSHEEHQIERRIYERLGEHPRIVKVYSIDTQGRYIILERMKYTLRHFLIELQKREQTPSSEQILRWSAQITEGFQYIHQMGVLQCDIGAHNVLLDWDNNVKLCDFAGSSIDEEEALVCPSPHSEYPWTSQETNTPTLKSELFALGSLLYEISTTRKPYQDYTERQIEQFYTSRRFPDTRGLLLGEIINKCWASQYKDDGDILADVELVRVRNLEAVSESIHPWASSAFVLLITVLLVLHRRHQ